MSALAQAAAPALDLHWAVRQAVQRAAGLQALHATASGWRQSAVAAGQLPDPMLRLSLDNVPVEGAERFSLTRDMMTMRSIGVMQTFTRADKRRARATRAEREAETALAERRAQAALVQRETAYAWFERRAQEQRVTALHEHLVVAQQQVEAADAAARGGRGTLVDAVAARDAVVRLRQALLAAEAELTSAQRSLARWTGTVPDLPLAAAPPITRLDAGTEGPEAIARHPDLAQWAARVAVADAAVELVRQERVPDWSAGLMFSQRGPGFANMVSVALSLPLHWDRPQRQDRELAARLADVHALRAGREERERELRAELGRWADGWRAGLARLALIDSQRKPLARQRIDAALAAYRGGGAPLAQVLEARRSALALQMERIDVELETARWWARLEFLAPDTAALAAKE
jgi:outer membrane protein TolC